MIDGDNMTFNSISELENYILSRMQDAIVQSQEKIYRILDEFVKKFYNEYEPVMYIERTYKLYHSLVKSEIVSTGKGYKAYVYFDYTSLIYTTGANPSGLQVVTAAAYGGHGAEGLKVVKSGVGIWNKPISILQTEAYEILKQSLIDAGIPIK